MVLLYAQGTIDVAKKAQELKVDVAALKATLQTLADTTREVSEAGNSINITNIQDNTSGRTETIMGNTDTARKGRLTRSQTGEADRTLWYVGLGALAIIAVAIVLSQAFG